MGRRARSADTLDADLAALVDRVSRRLRKARRVCRTVVLRVRFDDFSRATRSYTLPNPTAETATILAAARRLVSKAAPVIEARGLTLVGVALTNLEDGTTVQLSLSFGNRPVGVLDAAVDEVRARFGTGAITRAALIGREQGVTVPLLAD